MAQATIIQLQKQLDKKLDNPSDEDLAVIKETDLQSLECLFSDQLDDNFREQIRQAINYQQLVGVREKFIQKHISKNLEDQQVINSLQINQQLSEERAIWIILLTASLLAIGGLLIKIKLKRERK